MHFIRLTMALVLASLTLSRKRARVREPLRGLLCLVLRQSLAVGVCVGVSGQEDRVQRDPNLLASKAFHVAAQQILPAIVTIETYGGVATGARRGRIAGISSPGAGPTTGLIVSKDGLIVTSVFNFRDQPPTITVILRDGTKQVATLLASDKPRRICLLKIETEKELPVAECFPEEELRIGQWAISVGVGYGDFEPAISAGIISALKRFQGAVQTDANISPANYGGPLLAIDGRVIGICVPLHPSQKSDAAGVQWYDSGIGFAIPISHVRTMIVKAKGAVAPTPSAED